MQVHPDGREESCLNDLHAVGDETFESDELIQEHSLCPSANLLFSFYKYLSKTDYVVGMALSYMLGMQVSKRQLV